MIALWLVVFGLAAGFIPLYFLVSGIRNDAARRSGDLQLVQKSLTTVPTLPPTVQKLVDDLAKVEAPAKGIQDAYATVVAGRTDWRAILAAIGDYDPAQLSVTSLAYANNQITLNGQAVDDAAVTAYVRALERPNLFARVVIQSIQVMGTPTTTVIGTVVGPGVTPTATAITSTLAPVGDAYEVDDFSPKDIVFGQPQGHTFYPVYDVDKVEFLAKSGRFYRVYTFDLAPGVDTFLSVSVGGTTLTNDDRQPGDLGSEVVFQVTSSDTQAIVTVTNRGQYGTDKAYSIAVEEIVPTPTSTPSPIATSTSTATPIFTPTPTPIFTLTPTPDLRDKYEPDDIDPKPIAIGETQRHSFYPNGDIDKVQFLAKAGRIYRVTTSDLAIGVDTALKVQVGGTIYMNDDRQPGDLSSDVVFLVPLGSDVQAVVTVTDRGQYGPDKLYSITVEEIIPTPTYTPSPTATATATATPTLPPPPTATPTPPPPSTATPTNTLTPTSTSGAHTTGSISDGGAYPLTLTSLRLIPGMALPVLFYPAQVVEHPIPRLFEASRGERQPSGDTQMVEFVIVLELKR